MDKRTFKDIKRWYHEAGVPLLNEDWGARDEVTGESIGPQTQHREREGRDGVRSSATTPDRMWWWNKQRFPWRERTTTEKEWLYLLDQFFAPYLSMLPRAKGNLVREVFGEVRTYQEVADERGVRRQSAHEAVQRAVRDLTRLIALDDPLFHDPIPAARKRDFEEEARAARRVFVTYIATKNITLDPQEEA